MPEVKTKNTVKDIKVLDKSIETSQRMKNAFIRTKNETQDTRQIKQNSPTEYATDTTSQGAEKVTNEAVHQAKKHTMKILDKAKTATKAKKQAKKFTQQNIQKSVQVAKKATEHSIKSVPKLEKTIKQSARSTRKAIKSTSKGTIKTAKKSVKATRTSIKTTGQAVKTAQKTVQASKKSLQATRATARAVAKNTKRAIKATITAVKAIITAVKNLVILIIAGGWIAIFIILLICMAGLVINSIFGIFLSNEQTNPQTKTITQVLSELNAEYIANIEQIKTDNPHDKVTYNLTEEISLINWAEILAIYTVKTYSDPNNPSEVVTMTDEKIQEITTIFNDMVSITFSIRTEETKQEVEKTLINGDPITITETVTENILEITTTQKTGIEIAEQYGFSDEQKAQLNELLSEQYRSMWNSLLNGT